MSKTANVRRLFVRKAGERKCSFADFRHSIFVLVLREHRGAAGIKWSPLWRASWVAYYRHFVITHAWNAKDVRALDVRANFLPHIKCIFFMTMQVFMPSQNTEFELCSLPGINAKYKSQCCYLSLEILSWSAFYEVNEAVILRKHHILHCHYITEVF